ncbi:FAD-dependent oxidoreductase [Sphingobium bisphenolivorans]|uniref:FAD-dependent oxidoreductase n=1 Tax=Sphingobium bisphenolivorans TaxID=1335760 RepID=UPI00039DABE0|nr:FAD-dependent oxidoreductase [Sphingobium bisphenolivorans]
MTGIRGDGICDLVVVGSGAGGLAAAVTAAKAGLDVIVVEKSRYFGGTTAFAGGFLWIPNNHLARAAGMKDSAEEARRYVVALAGNHFDSERVDAYLDAGPQMLRFFMEQAGLKLLLAEVRSDFHSELPGAVKSGRSLFPAPVHAGILGNAHKRLRPPLPETGFMGVPIDMGNDLLHFLNVTRSTKSALFVAKWLVKHGYEMLRYGRAMEAVNGNSLVAQLAAAAMQEGVTILYDTPAVGLIERDGAVAGIRIGTSEDERQISARRGVVLASGGFPWDLARRAALYPHPANEDQHFSLAPRTNTGDGLRLAEQVGGQIITVANNGAWMPISRLPKPGGLTRSVPHSFMASMPGVIAVTPEGRRFVNESVPWQDYCEGLLTARRPGMPAEGFLIADHRAIRDYGLGFVRPAPVPMGPHLRSSYLMRGKTIRDLAKGAGIDAEALEATVERFNSDARAGKDTLFGRGGTRYSRSMGDCRFTPNPTLAPLETGPFYAVRIHAGDIGTLAGLRTDGKARVLDTGDRPIPGLFAAGNDAATIFGGAYPGAGSTIGPAMTFGFIAAREAAAAGEPQWA